ncbi:hypothetical protein IPJ72_03950 [Candidatus Peregrinibacteria bacterium]|nr:MAG: hypothetical protein IPJ72_03950 [Candidatus Peregrinibacteria bacterium]
MNTFKSWKGAFILVTHDRTFMERVVDFTVAIHRCKMRKMRGGPQKLMDQIAQEESVCEKTRVNQEKKQEKTLEFIRNFRSGAARPGPFNRELSRLLSRK